MSTDEWIEELKGISVLELSERIKALEEAFGVSGDGRCGCRPRRRQRADGAGWCRGRGNDRRCRLDRPW